MQKTIYMQKIFLLIVMTFSYSIAMAQQFKSPDVIPSSPQSQLIENFYEKYFYQNQLVFSPDMETATTNQILSLVQHDLGIGFCPEALAKDYLDRGEIIEIPVKEHANPRDICLLTDSTRPIGIAGKKLLEILMDSEE